MTMSTPHRARSPPLFIFGSASGLIGIKIFRHFPEAGFRSPVSPADDRLRDSATNSKQEFRCITSDLGGTHCFWTGAVRQIPSPAGATHETGWRDLTVYWGVTVLPLSTKGEWRCRSRNWSSIFQRSRIPGATHETLKILFQENPDVGDTFSAWETKLWIAVRLSSGSCGEDQRPSCVASAAGHPLPAREKEERPRCTGSRQANRS